MLDIILSGIKIVVLLGVLITIHELGHFIVAKLSKVKVNQFAIGFGPIIFQKQTKETKYALRLIPLGGFVSMEGEEGDSEVSNSFAKAKMYKKILIVAAGAIVNIVFAIIIYFILSATSGTYVSNEVGDLIENYAAEEIGIQVNDKLIELNGKKIKNKRNLDEISKDFTGENLEIKVNRNGEILKYDLKPTEQKSMSTGMYLGENSEILVVEKDSTAEKAGILANDELIKVNNVDVNGDPYKALELISNVTPEVKTLNLTIKRNDKILNLDVETNFVSSYYIGLIFKEAEDTLINRMINGVMQTEEFVGSSILNLKQLFTGNVSVNQMMGPVGISEVVAKTDGVREFFEMLALISLSLGITNLLPIPALDGGKIVILLIEIVRRKPMKKETEINIQLLGFSILIALSLYVTFNDIIRIF